MIKIHPLQNGKDRGWGFFRSLFDFFFPYTKRLRVEAITRVRHDWDRTIIVSREFFTLRSFVTHYAYEAIGFTKRFGMPLREYEYMRSIDPYFSVRGALAVDATTNRGNNPGNDTTDSFSHTVTGANPLLVSSTAMNPEAGTVVQNAPTYNSSALTLGVSRTMAGSVGRASLYYHLTPSTGANTFALSWDGNCYSGSGVISFSGADTSGIGATTSTTTISTTATVNITTTRNNSYVVDSVNSLNASGTSAPTVGADQTAIHTAAFVSTTKGAGGGSYESKATPGTVTMSWVVDGGNIPWVSAVLEVLEPSSFVPRIMIF